MKLTGAKVYRGGETHNSLKPHNVSDVEWLVTKSPADTWPVITLKAQLGVGTKRVTNIHIDLDYRAQVELIDIIKMHGEDILDYMLGNKETLQTDNGEYR